MLDLERETRLKLWRRLGEVIEGYWRDVPTLRVAPRLDRDALRALLAGLDFQTPLRPLEALELAAAGLREHQVHTPHPRYFGLFNPAPTAMGVVADALIAAFNPQLAAWSHSPLAAEIELHLVRAFGARFGWDPATTDGVFASGGAEANHTALLAALVHAFPSFAEHGARSLPRAPVLYTSSEAHHSFLKAARLCGLGTAAVRAIPVDDALRLDVSALERQLEADRAARCEPFFVAATLGTTGAGVLDPIEDVAPLARREHLWLHADAAWGGAIAIVPELRPLLAGVERADSISIDAHKWLSVPMAAGLLLTRHPQALERSFRVAAGYMPKDAVGMPVVDPYAHSMQWSRRFIGLKVFLSLAVAGWDGYADVIRRMTALGERLKQRLARSGWRVVNRTPLPLACFVDEQSAAGDTMEHLERLARAVVGSGRAWISTVQLAGRMPALRACITNYRTGPDDVDALVAALDDARSGLGSRP